MRRYIDSIARETVVVHHRDGTSMRGVLMAVHRDCIVLAHASVLGAEANTPIDGEAVIERAQVSWLQRLPVAEA